MSIDTKEILKINRLPARLNVEQTAELLGFAKHDIPVLVSRKLLKPLGNPVQNATKYFALMAIDECRNSEEWLSKATKAIGQNWQFKNSHKRLKSMKPPGTV